MFFKRKKKAPALLGKRCVAVVAAAGSSTRMEGRDKLLEPLGGEPVIVHTLRALDRNPYIHDIVVVTRSDLLVDIGALCRDKGIQKVSAVLLGGDTRLESVYKAVNQIPRDAKLIAVHDGARPLVSRQVIIDVCSAAAKYPAVAPAVPVKDTVKEVDHRGFVVKTLERDQLRAVQTPQVFDADLLRGALQKAMEEGSPVTDDCSAVEAMGIAVTLIPGDERNIKITTPLDLALAQALLEQEG